MLAVKETYLPSEKVLVADYLGLIPYDLALKLQKVLVQARAKGDIPDVLLLLQHPPVFTTGRFRGEEDIAVPQEFLSQQGLAVFHTERGGSITYHGPGQLVGYPILNLKENGLGVRQYIWRLEEVIIDLLLAFGIQGRRVAKYPGGVWAGDKKVCSIGINVSHYVTMHGFALNVSSDLRYFEYIRPCGLESKAMTSLSELLGHPVEVKSIIRSLLHSFSDTFGLEYERGDSKWLATPGVLSG